MNNKNNHNSQSLSAANGDGSLPGAPEAEGSRKGVAKAGGWALSSRAIAQAAQLAIFIVAARVLTPADFGLFALVQAGSVLLFVVAAAGWREFIMGWGGGPRAINQAITLSFLSGYLMCLVGVAGAATLSLFYDSPTITLLVLLFSACVLLSPITNAYGAILVRRGDVRAMALATIVAEVAGLVTGIAGLMSGWGILALAAGKLVMQVINLTGVMVAAKWPTQLIVFGGYGTRIVDVSKQILANRVIGFVMNNSSTFVVGSFLGVANVGFFRAAERVVSSISELVFEPLRLLGWMMFRSAADKGKTDDQVREELKREAGYFLPLLIVFASPIFVGLTLVSEGVVVVLLGEAWRPAAQVAAILGATALLTIPTVATEPLLTITGKINRLPPVSLFNALVTVAVLIAFVQFGLLAAAGARFFAGAVVMATNIWLQTKYAEAPWGHVIKNAAPVYTGLLALIGSVLGSRFLLASYEISTAGQLAVEVVIGAILYFGVILIIRPTYLRSLLWH